jgi:hypothetical protein
VAPDLSREWHRFTVKKNRSLNFGRTTHPFLSGDAFKRICDFSVDNAAQLTKIEKVQNVNSLFVNSNLLANLNENSFFGHSPSVVFVGNSDLNFESSLSFPETVQKMYVQNYAGPPDPRIKSLPIGLENRKIGNVGVPKFYSHRDHNFEKRISNKVLVPPMSKTNPVREKVLDIITGGNSGVFDVVTEYLTPTQYFNLVRQYKFVLCLEGNGYDTHRIWETLYLESFPVVLNTSWSTSLNYLDLPILGVNQIGDINSDLLFSFAKLNHDFCSLDRKTLWIDEWKNSVLASNLI